MAKVTYVSKYRKNNSLIRIYALDCTKEELALYKEAKGEFYREGTEGKAKGKPLVFTTLTTFGEGCSVAVTTKGNVVEDGFIEGEAMDLVADKHIGKFTSSELRQAKATKYVETGSISTATQQRRNVVNTILAEAKSVLKKEEEPVDENPAGSTVGETELENTPAGAEEE